MEKTTALKKLNRSSFAHMSHRDIASMITLINKEYGYWEAKQEFRVRPVPNMSGRVYNPHDTYEVVKDYILDGKFDESFQQLLLAAARKKRIALYVHDSEFGFYPIFAVFIIKRGITKNKSECLIKLMKNNLSKDVYSDFLKRLYSTDNKKKLFRIRMTIKKLSSYEY